MGLDFRLVYSRRLTKCREYTCNHKTTAALEQGVAAPGAITTIVTCEDDI